MILQLLLLAFALFGYQNVGATIVFDPWMIADRKAISSSLLNCTYIPAVFGADNLGNVLWGLDIQTLWQISSGRQQSSSSVRIDEFAWFANINYFLTIVPYLVAMKSNLLPATAFLPSQTNSPAKYPVVYEEIDSEIALDWTNYFETVKRLQTDPTYVSLASLQHVLWHVHNSTVIKALPKFKAELQLLNRQERRFANGFAHFVEVLAILNLDTSYHPIHSLNQLFPQRQLRSFDMPPLILDMSPQQNIIISAYFTVASMVEAEVWTIFVQTLRNAIDDVRCGVKLLQTFNDFLKAPKGDLIFSIANVFSSFC